jgi:hypothetical protein
MEYWSVGCPGLNAVFHYSVTPPLSPSFRPSWRLLARAGIQEIHGKLDYRFRGNDDGEALTYSMVLRRDSSRPLKKTQRRGTRKIDERRRTQQYVGARRLNATK